MEYKRAIEIIQNLINNVDPYTGHIFNPDNCYMNVEINKALTEAVKALKKDFRKDSPKQFPQSNEKLSKDAKLLLLAEQYESGMTIKEFGIEHQQTKRKIKKLLIKLGKILHQSQRSKRKSRAFDQFENKLLIKRFDEGMELSQIANKHNRTQKEIKKQLLMLGKFLSLRQKPERAGQKWDLQENKLLSERFDNGMNISQLAEKHQRTKGAITSRLVRIGKIDRKC
ncbi:MAG: hypothetical protein JXA96_18410 [Sedimentisphaerales bacterium]|nr:hypothetical protein [Sedimentisphaerales bacterium]